MHLLTLHILNKEVDPLMSQRRPRLLHIGLVSRSRARTAKRRSKKLARKDHISRQAMRPLTDMCQKSIHSDEAAENDRTDEWKWLIYEVR